MCHDMSVLSTIIISKQPNLSQQFKLLMAEGQINSHINVMYKILSTYCI